jgi:uncharacterized protein (UPF0218 family)
VSNEIKYKLPDSLRETLKEPLGFLFNEEELFNYIKESNQKIVCVGDLVSYTLISHHFTPIFCIVDNHTKRQDLDVSKVELIHEYGKRKITINNPAGVITYELWDQIETLLKNNDYEVLIEVNGEEDLASLAVILLAPSDVTIIYGMPDKGVVVVPATEHHKEKVKKIIAQM